RFGTILAELPARGSARPAIGVKMSDLTTPVASSIALPASAAPHSANATGTSSSGGFCEVMNDKEFKPKLKAPSDAGDRQGDAATGKDLPEKDKDVDPALAWL